jgi:hypothetical protein
MRETEVLRMFLARAENYEVKNIKHTRGRAYLVEMGGKTHNAVVLLNSFQYYELQYHIAKVKPSLIICYRHDTVLPIEVLSMRASRIAKAYELPEEIEDLEEQRHNKTGARVLLGMYISGLRRAQDIIHDKDFPKSTRNRYLQRAKELGRRRPGRPVDTQKAQNKIS